MLHPHPFLSERWSQHVRKQKGNKNTFVKKPVEEINWPPSMWNLFCDPVAVHKCTLHPDWWDSVVRFSLMLLMVEAGTPLTFGVSNPCCGLQVYRGKYAITRTGVSRRLSLDVKIWPQWEKIKVISITECWEWQQEYQQSIHHGY